MPEKDAEDTIKNRRIARRMMNEAASKGDAIAGMSEAMEYLASPFFLGVDEDEDDSDLAVFP